MQSNLTMLIRLSYDAIIGRNKKTSGDELRRPLFLSSMTWDLLLRSEQRKQTRDKTRVAEISCVINAIFMFATDNRQQMADIERLRSNK